MQNDRDNPNDKSSWSGRFRDLAAAFVPPPPGYANYFFDIPSAPMEFDFMELLTKAALALVAQGVVVFEIRDWGWLNGALQTAIPSNPIGGLGTNLSLTTRDLTGPPDNVVVGQLSHNNPPAIFGGQFMGYTLALDGNRFAKVIALDFPPELTPQEVRTSNRVVTGVVDSRSGLIGFSVRIRDLVVALRCVHLLAR